MEHIKRGVAALITTPVQSNLLMRLENNVLNMEGVLNKMGFSVHTYRECSSLDIGRILNDWNEEDHSGNSCFMCVLMSPNSSDIPSIGEIVSHVQFNVSLKGKPKIYFIETQTAITTNPCLGHDNYIHLGHSASFIPIVISTLGKDGENESLHHLSLTINHALGCTGEYGRVVTTCNKDIFFN